MAAICVLVLGTIAANDVAPSKAELEAMYDKAFRAFDGGHYDEALKQLDAIDARKPDLAESQNLRGAILMRQGAYDKAEAALAEAHRLDPNFWNARFNLAEIPFLRKDWPEARKRFEELLGSGGVELQGEATHLIQYKILLTYLAESNDTMVDTILAKLNSAPNSPAADYARAAISLQHQNITDAKTLLAVAEKKFSPALNNLFAESLYQIGWLQKEEQHAGVQAANPEERSGNNKSDFGTTFEQAQQAYEQRNFDKAATLAAQADAAEPNRPATANLRGAIALGQGKLDEAETFFEQALKLDNNYGDAQLNLAEVPFRRKDYSKARARFEALAKQAKTDDKRQPIELIRFKIFMTYLLENNDSRAQKLMEQFEFSGDTPALYYAQAAWEFHHGNAGKANDWITSARKIYPLAANSVYSSGFYDLGWLKSSAPAASPTAASNAIASARNDTAAPAIEPSPIPGAETKAEQRQSSVLLAQASPVPPVANSASAAPLGGEQARADSSPSSDSPPEAAASATPGQPEDTRAAPASSAPPPAEFASATPAPSAAALATPSFGNAAADGAPTVSVMRQPSPTPETDRSESPPSKSPAIPTESGAAAASHIGTNQAGEASPEDRFDPWTDWRILVVAGLALGGLGMAWMFAPELRGRGRRPVSPATKKAQVENPPKVEPAVLEQTPVHPTFDEGPRHVSVELKGTQPSLRRGAIPVNKRTPEVAPGANGIDQLAGLVGDFSEPTVGPVREHPQSEEDALAAAPPNGKSGLPAEEKAAEESRDRFPAEEEQVWQRFQDETPPRIAPPREIDKIGDAAGEHALAAASNDSDVSKLHGNGAALEPAPLPSDRQDVPSRDFGEAAPEQAEQTADFAVPQLIESARGSSDESAENVAASFPESAERSEPPPANAAPPLENTSDSSMTERIFEGQPVPFQSVPPSAQQTGSGNEESEAGQVIPPAIGTMAVSVSSGVAWLPSADPRPSAPPAQENEAICPPSGPNPATPTEPEAFINSVTTRPPPDKAADEVASAASIPEPAPIAEPTNTENMPETQTPPAPATRTPNAAPPAQPVAYSPAQQPPPAQHTSAAGTPTTVQITLWCEIAAMQLTPTFKMGALQLRPTSKVVTMRLAPSLQQQGAMNLQVNFEIARVQPAAGSLGQIRLKPSEQQKPALLGSPSFSISGLQVVPGFETAPLQLTPQQQGQACVQLLAPFQITTVEFSPTFDVGGIILNAMGKNVSLQLPGAGSTMEFEIANVQLAPGGEIGILQLNPVAAHQ